MCKIMEDIVKEEVEEAQKKVRRQTILNAHQDGRTIEDIASFMRISLDEVLEAIEGKDR